MKGDTLNDNLQVFKNADFNWAAQLQDVWHDAPWDVPNLHEKVRKEFSDKLDQLKRERVRSPLGWLLVGSGGVGKTHLLSAIRKQASQQGVGFVLVDMTDVRDFWDVVLQGYLDSLQTLYVGEEYQYQVLFRQFIKILGARNADQNLSILARRKTEALSDDLLKIVSFLRKSHPKEAMEYQDAIRALICLNSHSLEISATGYNWLQGQDIDADVAAKLGFTKRQRRASEIVRALSWIMSLSGPTILAFDQLDPIIQQYRHQAAVELESTAMERGTALTIIEQIGAGLAAVTGMTYKTLVIVSGVESTFSLLEDLTSRTYLDRFEDPYRLERSEKQNVYELIIGARLGPVYQEAGFVPPYPTWPFSPRAIAGLGNESVREVLKLCERHRRDCLLKGEVTELQTFRVSDKATPPTVVDPVHPPPAFAELERQFQNYFDEASPEDLLEEKQEDERLAPLYRTALQCLIHEHEAEIPEHIEPMVEHEFSGGRTTKPLHARLRVVDHQQESREDHFCIRALQRAHHGAYQARLKAAMTQSGIDKSLKFRHLVIVRTLPLPGGSQTELLTRKFRDAGGRIHNPTNEELRTLAALQRLVGQHDPHFPEWLQQRRPVSKLGLGTTLTPGSRFDDAEPKDLTPAANPTVTPATTPPESSPVAPPVSPAATPAATQPTTQPIANPATPIATSTATPTGTTTPSSQSPSATTTKSGEPQSGGEPGSSAPGKRAIPGGPDEHVSMDPNGTGGPSPAMSGSTVLSFGRAMIGMGELGDPMAVPLPLLAKHTIILGGSGSGKSVTVRRLVEEAALAGIPSIVVDCAQDMCFFDQVWSSPPPGWQEGDPARAAQFSQCVEQIVWTPGSLSSGNPLSFRPLPDFTDVRDDPEDLQDAVAMAGDGLRQIVAPGNSQKSRNCEGILAKSLRHFAIHFPDKGLGHYIEMLRELPQQAEVGVPNEQKLAQDMAGSLSAARETNPLFGGAGRSLDPAVLFGDDSPRPKTRISVISLVKMMSQDAAQGFLNQLAMELFAWIKRHPTPPGDRPLRGLLVIDEARDFVPSLRSSLCKESVMRLAAQARKYRLGLVFATQHPKDIDTKIVGNCATHLYGLNNSPAALETLGELMKLKGASGSGDIPKLKAGQFYFHNAEADLNRPLKIQIPMSLTYSPSNPLEESEILRKGEQSRELL
jgi:hypothetical protein